jgi:hypothetical protein
MGRSVAILRPNVSEERIASIIRVTRIAELETTLAVTSNRNTPNGAFLLLRIILPCADVQL